MRGDKEYFDELHQLASTKDDEFIDDLKCIRCRIREDETLTSEQKRFYEEFYSLQIFWIGTMFPFVSVVCKIWEHQTDVSLEEENLSDKYGGDTLNDTYEKLQSSLSPHPQERQEQVKQYLSLFRNIERMIYDGLYDAIIEEDTEKFKNILYEISNKDNELVIQFQKQVNFKFKTDKMLQHYCVNIKNLINDVSIDKRELFHQAEMDMRNVFDDPDSINDAMSVIDEIERMSGYFSYDNPNCLTKLQEEFERKRGVDNCIQDIRLIKTNSTKAWLCLFYMCQPSKEEEYLVQELFHKSDDEEFCMKVLEEVKSVTVNDRENEIFNEFCDKHFKDEPEYRKQKHGKPFVETPEIHVIETPQRDERSVAYDQLCEKIFPQEKDKQRFQELMGALIEADFLKKTSHGKLIIGTEGNKKYLGYVVKAIEQNLYIEQNKLTKLICKETNKDDTKYTDYSGNDLRTAVSEGKKMAQSECQGKTKKRKDCLDSILKEYGFDFPKY